MEGLVNPKESDLKKIHYIIWKDEPICSGEGLWYIEYDERNFGIEAKITKLNEIMTSVLSALNNISDDNKENLINTIKTKQDLLADILKSYKEIKNDFIQFDSYYRKQLFDNTYKIKYWEASFFSFAEKNLCMSIMNDIQIQLKKAFEKFLFKYFDLRNNFFNINNYIIKIIKLFNIVI